MFFSFRKEKNEKKPRTYRSIICAAGSGSVAAMKDGVHARETRVIRQSPPLLLASCRRALTRRAPCACGRELPSRSYFPHGEWWPVRAPRALQHLRAVCICFPVDEWESETGVSVLPCNARALHSTIIEVDCRISNGYRLLQSLHFGLLVLFSSLRKAYTFLIQNPKRVSLWVFKYLLQCCLCGFAKRRKSFLIVYRKLRKHLAIERDAGLLQPAHKS